MLDLLPLVTIPARNEEKRIPALFSALSSQSWLQNPKRRLHVFIVLNNCTDGSARAVADAAARHRNLSVEAIDITFETALAHVGSARRLAMEMALGRCDDPGTAVLFTTDADAVPARGWIEACLRHIVDGVDIVGGLIIGDETEEEMLGPDFKRRAMLHQRYAGLVDRLTSLLIPIPHDPWPRHHDHTGASLAVRADAYRAVGGMPALSFREDVAFVSRMLKNGYLLRHPLDVTVHVSARLAGRAPGGMADCLKDWMRAAAVGAPLLVEDPHRVLERLRQSRVLDDMRNTALDDTPMGIHWTELEAPATVPVEYAIEAIERMIAEAEGDACAA